MRLNTNGHLDSSFATNGIITPDSTIVLNYSAVAIDKNDNIVAGGYGVNIGFGMFVAAHYLGNLSLNFASDAVMINKNAAVEKNKTVPLIYPNPIQSHATLTYTMDKAETVSIYLCDVNGRIIKNILTNNKIVAGTHKQDIYFESSILPGNYMLVVQTATRKASIKVIKQ